MASISTAAATPTMSPARARKRRDCTREASGVRALRRPGQTQRLLVQIAETCRGEALGTDRVRRLADLARPAASHPSLIRAAAPRYCVRPAALSVGAGVGIVAGRGITAVERK